MIAITNALIDYWQRLPANPLPSRRQSLEIARGQVRDGALPPRDLVPFALADIDEDVVFDATADYIATPAPRAAGEHAPVDDALEWIRRGLALNRGAVFAALLSAGNPELDKRLAAYRLTLAADETAAICRKVARSPHESTSEFLRSWLELLGGDPSRVEVRLISAALAGVGP